MGMKHKLKKGQDVLEVVDASGEYPVLLKAGSKEAKAILRALERVVGDPALDDFGASKIEGHTVTIHRYRLEEDIELVEE
jgi:hypothetical protein